MDVSRKIEVDNSVVKSIGNKRLQTPWRSRGGRSLKSWLKNIVIINDMKRKRPAGDLDFQFALLPDGLYQWNPSVNITISRQFSHLLHIFDDTRRNGICFCYYHHHHYNHNHHRHQFLTIWGDGYK